MLHRRAFGSFLAASAASAAWPRSSPAVFRAERDRPAIAQGVASGDVGGGSAVVWSRTDRPSRMVVEWSTTDSFRDARTVIGPATLPEDDFAAKVVLTDLPPGQRIMYRVTFRDLASPKARSFPAPGEFFHPVVDEFRHPGSDPVANVRFAWGGDVAGQGYGINPDLGGMRIFESIRRARPDFFLHSGDHIYADNPIPSEIRLDDGSTWRNLVDAGDVQGRRDPGRVPGPLSLQPARRERPPVQRRGPHPRPVGRPRDPEQLVSRRVARRRPVFGQVASTSWPRGPAGRSSTTCRPGSTPGG